MAGQSGGESGAVRWCPACASPNQTEFAAEMIIHFSGSRYIDYPGVLQSPRILICGDCGFARFALQEDARVQLVQALRTRGPATVCAQRNCAVGSISPLDVRQ
jgi:hypothetical protein